MDNKNLEEDVVINPEQNNIGDDEFLSVVVPIAERHDDLKRLFYQYAEELKKTGKKYEFLFVVSEGFDNAIESLKELKDRNPEVRVIKLNCDFGEATALSVGFKKARGNIIITLQPYFQVEPEGIHSIIKKLEEGNDLVITRRYPRVDSVMNRMHTGLFHWLINKFTGMPFHDISCGLRGMKRIVAKEIRLYGDLHRFIPILARMKGFSIAEINVKQSIEELNVRIYKPGVYIRRLLDIFAVFFLFKFTKKPLRFFGLIGMYFFAPGLLINLFLSIQRVIGKVALADRPMLLLGVLIMVLGIQLISIGLLGEIIIYTHSRETKDYQIEEIFD